MLSRASSREWIGRVTYILRLVLMYHDLRSFSLGSAPFKNIARILALLAISRFQINIDYGKRRFFTRVFEQVL